MPIEWAVGGMMAAFLFGVLVMSMFKASGAHSCIECDFREHVDQSSATAGRDIVGGSKITKGE